MERLDEMMEYLRPVWNIRFEADQKQIENYFQQYRERIMSDFRSIISRGIAQQASMFQTAENPEEFSYLTICCLHSSILDRSYEYEVSLYHKSLYVDQSGITDYWCPEFLYQYAADQESFLKEQLQQKFIGLQRYETELIRKQLFLEYWDVARTYFKLLTDDLMEDRTFSNLKVDHQFCVLYGEYMGELENI